MSSDVLNRRKRVVNRNGDSNEDNLTSQEVSPESTQNQSITKRVMSLMALSMVIFAMVYYYTTQTNDTNELVMATVTQSIMGSPIGQQVTCSQDYTEDRVRFPSCGPQRCGRFVSDSVITQSDAKHLLSVAKRGLSLGGRSGGEDILSLHTGVLFQQNEEVFTGKDLEVYRRVTNKVRKTIAYHFGVPFGRLYLTNPTFFARKTPKRAQTKDDKYWVRHVDRHTAKCYSFTSLLYLSTYGADFTGGRFIFTDQMSNHTIEPKLGRLAAFTSGAENEHFVERFTSGHRYSLLMAFTCNPKCATKTLQILIN
ncbi:unnamed protein product [Oppiella nova]|uniref:Fe2OG dioxygenase domain-containing protein n=1 Tax=Oppiella nova TaxID=334625 RepID=A0A7R9M5S5_9ACAR|nr:unnamed protein product [Oppiella nova]CAG2170021.1 unnamed protein product [Oppiella nova]